MDIKSLISDISYQSLEVEKSLAYLRLGLPVLVNGNIIFSAQTVNHKILDQFDELYIFITSNRASYLFEKKINSSISIKINNNVKKKIKEFCFENNNLDYKEYQCEDLSNYDSIALELLKISGLLPCAIMIKNFDKNLDQIPSIKYESIKQYKRNFADLITESVNTNLVLKHAKHVKFITFRSHCSDKEHYALIIGKNKKCEIEKIPVIRIHSSCVTGDIFNSMYCDCGSQLQEAIKFMAKNEGGIIIYLNQEGRGIGLDNKLRAYNLKHLGYDTVEANEILGFDKDERDFYVAAKILKILGVDKVKIITNNPKKIQEVSLHDVKVLENISHLTDVNEHNLSYLKTKAVKLDHNIDEKNLKIE